MKKLLVALALLLSLFFVYQTGIIQILLAKDPQSLVSLVQGFGALSPLLLIGLVILEAVAAPVPPLILYVASGLIYGSFWGGTIVLVGNLLGALAAFYIARILGKEYFEKKIGKKKLKKFNEYAEEKGALALFFLRINPITSSDVFSYAAGLTRMSYKSLLLGTGLGLAPLVYLQTYIGYVWIKNSPLLYQAFILLSLVYLVMIVVFLVKLFQKK